MQNSIIYQGTEDKIYVEVHEYFRNRKKKTMHAKYLLSIVNMRTAKPFVNIYGKSKTQMIIHQNIIRNKDDKSKWVPSTSKTNTNY